MGPGGRSAVNGVVPNCFPPAKIVDPGGSLVKTTWPPLLIVAAAMTTLSSNVSLIPPKLPLYFRTTRRAWLVFRYGDKHLPHFSSSCFSNDLSGIIIASDHPL